jgi:GcrA cell cycle regulator
MSAAPWPDERVVRLKAMWADGLSATDIAMRLGGGATRNAVIGKVHRLGLSLRGNTSKAARCSTRKVSVPIRIPNRTRKHLPNLPTEPLPPREVVDIARVSFVDMDPRKHCRFIPGDLRSFKSDDPLYCGEAPFPGSAYCVHHTRRCNVGLATPAPRRTYVDYRMTRAEVKRAMNPVDARNFEIAE